MRVLKDITNLDAFFSNVANSVHPALFLDYDGTLAPFREQRDQAVPYKGLRKLLAGIIEETNTRVAFITGRPVDDLLELLDLDSDFEVFGSHGWEHLGLNGQRETFPLQADAEEALTNARNWIEEERLGPHSESKAASVTLHWRDASKAEAEQRRLAAKQAWGSLATRGAVEVHEFDGGLELRVPGKDKGTAISAALDTQIISDAATFLGDDLTDEDAFKALNETAAENNRLSVLVRPEFRETAADLWLTPPNELFEFLTRWRASAPKKNRPKDTEMTKRKNNSTDGDTQDKVQRLVVVSNRLPIRMNKDESGEWDVKPSPGGLVTALNPILENKRGTWIGWIGAEGDDRVDEVLGEASADFPCSLKSVPLTEEEENLYYRGFSNEALWPLFHDLLGYCRFEEKTWEKYQEINERFADKVMESAGPNDIIWIHDYQLCLVGHYLRNKGCENPLLYFLHIPFPSTDLFRRLPWRREIVDGLLEYDLVGFQTLQDRQNFVNTVGWIYPDVGMRERKDSTTLYLEDRRMTAGNWAISIDFDEFYDKARSDDVKKEAWIFHEHFGERNIIIGLDRLDYTKGIPDRILAYERFLEKYPEMHRKVSLYQVVVPSRTHVPDYQNLKEQIDMLVGRINGKYSKAGWTPLVYVYGSFNRTELLGRYAACELALITPLRDGMNLVAKEYVTSCIDDRGVLMLSEFAGAAEELGDGAILVNPFDIEKTADAIYQGLTMPPEERRDRLNRLRTIVRENDVHAWVRSIFTAAGLKIYTE